MLTADQIKALSDTEAQQRLDELATAYFGTTRWKALMAQFIGYERLTVQNWFKDGSRPPAFALILLEMGNQNREVSIALRSLKTAIDLARKLPDE